MLNIRRIAGIGAVILLAMGSLPAQNRVPAPKPYGPVPTKAQLEWQKMEMNMFCHFGPNTFTGLEWGAGTEPEDIFNPLALDCNQWVSVAKAAEFGGIILTAKHHDGFCLWPNPESNHTVSNSSWRDGKGDVLAELSAACLAGGVKFGIYISPWDRNAPTYGTPAYNKVFLKTLQHAHTNYGPIFEQWFDGANGEGPNGKRQNYDWKKFNAKTRKLQPDAVIFSDVGPGCRWVGNEIGKCGRTCWSRLDIKGYGPGIDAPSQDTLNAGNYNGACWVPAEADVSIRPGWFWKESEQPKSLKELMEIYYNSVGRNSLLLLNVPPDNRGLIPKEDSLRLVEFRGTLDRIFSDDLAKKAIYVCATNERGIKSSERCRPNEQTSALPAKFSVYWLLNGSYDQYWTTDDSVTSAIVELQFSEPQMFNRVMLQEYIPLGQRVERFHVEILDERGVWRTVADETTVGYKRIVLTETITTKKVKICIDKSRACPVLNRVGLFYDDESYFNH